MNIYKKRERNTVPYKNVQAGQVFEADSTIYLKIDPIYTDEDTVIDSIILENGMAQENYIDDNSIVTLLNATLVIDD